MPSSPGSRSDELDALGTGQAVQERDAGLQASAAIGQKGAPAPRVPPALEATVVAQVPRGRDGLHKGAWCSERKEFSKRGQSMKNGLPEEELQPSANAAIPAAVCPDSSWAFGEEAPPTANRERGPVHRLLLFPSCTTHRSSSSTWRLKGRVVPEPPNKPHKISFKLSFHYF